MRGDLRSPGEASEMGATCTTVRGTGLNMPKNRQPTSNPKKVKRKGMVMVTLSHLREGERSCDTKIDMHLGTVVAVQLDRRVLDPLAPGVAT